MRKNDVFYSAKLFSCLANDSVKIMAKMEDFSTTKLAALENH